jgi:transposase
MSQPGTGPGSPPSLISMRNAWCSSTKPTPRPRWPGRAPQEEGRRAAWALETTICTGALRVDGMTAPMVLNDPMNRAALQAYIEQMLVPTLRRGGVMLDNLPAHKGIKARQATKAAGTTLRYLPPTSPDINPIENAFPKLKYLLERLPRVLSATCEASSATPCRPLRNRTTPTT